LLERHPGERHEETPVRYGQAMEPKAPMRCTAGPTTKAAMVPPVVVRLIAAATLVNGSRLGARARVGMREAQRRGSGA
jgi:hypothetical protein